LIWSAYCQNKKKVDLDCFYVFFAQSVTYLNGVFTTIMLESLNSLS
jgi:hypothetical protein